MKDLSPLERLLFDWLSRRSESLLLILPFIVFLGVALVGVVAVSAVGGRSPLGDLYASWLIVVLVIAALVLYLATVEVMAVALLRTRRFRLLQLHQTMRDIQAMSWREFEDLVAGFYQAKGYAVEPRGGDGPDGGIDMIVRKNNLSWIVQCKHYRSQWVEEPPLRDLLGVVTAKGPRAASLWRVECSTSGPWHSRRAPTSSNSSAESSCATLSPTQYAVRPQEQLVRNVEVLCVRSPAVSAPF